VWEGLQEIEHTVHSFVDPFWHSTVSLQVRISQLFIFAIAKMLKNWHFKIATVAKDFIKSRIWRSTRTFIRERNRTVSVLIKIKNIIITLLDKFHFNRMSCVRKGLLAEQQFDNSHAKAWCLQALLVWSLRAGIPTQSRSAEASRDCTSNWEWKWGRKDDDQSRGARRVPYEALQVHKNENSRLKSCNYCHIVIH
jgi:hypothetical protein